MNMSLNPTYDFDMTPEQLESFCWEQPKAAVAPRAVAAAPEFVPVSQRELEEANAAFSRMLEAFNAAA